MCTGNGSRSHGIASRSLYLVILKISDKNPQLHTQPWSFQAPSITSNFLISEVEFKLFKNSILSISVKDFFFLSQIQEGCKSVLNGWLETFKRAWELTAILLLQCAMSSQTYYFRKKRTERQMMLILVYMQNCQANW